MTKIQSGESGESQLNNALKKRAISNELGEDNFIDNIFPWDTKMTFKEEVSDESHNFFKTIGENIQEGLAIVEGDDVIYINDRVCEIFGYTREELITLRSVDVAAPEEKERLQQLNQDLHKVGASPNDLEFWILSKDGTKRCIHNHYSTFQNGDNTVSRFLITNDITERKLAEEDLKKRMMKFKLDDGRFYLVKETSLNMALEAFKDILKIGYHGLVISRTPETEFHKDEQDDEFEFVWLAEKGDKNSLKPKLKELESKIRDLTNKTAVLFDGVNYLMFKNGFKNTLSLIQRLREYIYLTGNIIIMSLDPSTLNTQELRLLEKECMEIEPRVNGEQLPREFHKILRFIHQNNSIGVKPSYTIIGHELGVSKPTVRKRVRKLISNGYIIEDVKGRNKIVELTEMGRNLFFK